MMSPKEALEILKAGTEPQVQGRITREGYAQIDAAIAVISNLVHPPAPPPPAPPAPAGSS
jgi:hypothetical protein